MQNQLKFMSENGYEVIALSSDDECFDSMLHEQGDIRGIRVNMELNDKTMGEDVIISTPDSKVATVVVTTDEEYVIASDTFRLVNGK